MEFKALKVLKEDKVVVVTKEDKALKELQATQDLVDLGVHKVFKVQ